MEMIRAGRRGDALSHKNRCLFRMMVSESDRCLCTASGSGEQRKKRMKERKKKNREEREQKDSSEIGKKANEKGKREGRESL